MKNIFVLLLTLVFSLPLFAQDNFCESIIVEGKSTVEMAPEIITFSVNFSVRDTNYTRCANLALQKIEFVKKQFTTNGIDEKLIETVNYSIREEREIDRELGTHVFKGYRAEIPVLIKTKMDHPKKDQIFEIIKNNFKANFNLSFDLSPQQIEKIKKELIKLAVEDAKTKAELLAESAGVKLGKISKIQYGEPQAIRNFTRSNYDLRESIQIRGMSSTMGIGALTPPLEKMQTTVIIAWKMD